MEGQDKLHNVRRICGKKRGQFAKTNVVEARKKNVVATMKRRALDREEKQQTEVAELNRRIININTFGSDLYCHKCQRPLSILDRTSELKYGLASVFTIPCMECQTEYQVRTDEKNSANSYSINSAIAFGMLDNGLGERQINSLLSAADIPTISPTTLKKYERLVGVSIEEVAKETCIESIRLEKKMTLNSIEKEAESVSENVVRSTDKNADELSSEKVHLKSAFDCGWQKRGNGRSYNSLSGHATAIGYYSGKIISYSIRCEDCRLCKLGHLTTDHDCRLNYNGSAKSMEADMAVEMFTKNHMFAEENVDVNVIIGDDDSSTIAALQRESGNKFIKWSDFNHVHKNFNNALYAIKLPRKLIEYFSKCFAYSIKQNINDAQKIKKALLSVVPHAFGDHENCDDWCTARNSTEEYLHTHLPSGKPLEDADLRVSLLEIFSKYANGSEKISKCASTQGNESMNNIIASKNPKSRHYAGSESLSYRISAAVCQKNVGLTYSHRVFKKLKIKSGYISRKYRQNRDKIRNIQNKIKQTIACKRRRLQLKKKRSQKGAAKGRKEGISYSSGMSFESISQFIQINNSENEIEVKSRCEVVIFDIETSGLHKNDVILQIAATTTTSTFNTYIIPSEPIKISSTEITGLHMINKNLFLHEEQVQAVSEKEALFLFLNYLRQFNNVILLAHNGFRFDFPRLIKLVMKCQLLQEFYAVVKGFSDSLIILREKYVERLKNKKKFSITALTNDYLEEENTKCLHNATEDVRILMKLLIKLEINDNIIRDQSKSFNFILKTEKDKVQEYVNKATLMEYRGQISDLMIKKMAKAGINKNTLLQIFKINGKDGIKFLMSESIGGKPRVSNNKKILEKICELVSQI